MRILLRAPLLTSSGYGVHSRQVFEWLSSIENVELDVECLNWGMTPWLLNGEYENGLIKKIMQHSKKVTPPYDITFQLQLPDEWDPKLGKFNIGMSAVVETNRCNPKWIDACNQMNHIVVPSEFTKRVLKRSGIITTPVTVIPEWYNESIDNYEEIKSNDEFSKISTKFNFLIISQLNAMNPEDDRKNIFNTIKWLCEEFKNEKDVGIILKTNSGKNTTIDKKHTKDILSQMTKTFKKQAFPKIYLLHGNMSKNEIVSLYRRDDVKCYVGVTRGEGYGLPLVDAAAAGVPVVATNWSGHLDFLKDSFVKIDYTLKEIRKEKIENRIFLEGFKWAEPSEEDFKKKVRNFYNNPEKHNNDAATLQESTRKAFSKNSIIKIYNNFLNESILKRN